MPLLKSNLVKADVFRWGERDWQPWQPWPQVVYIFIHEPTWTKALRANCPLLSQNRLRAVMMRPHCRQNGSMNLCKAVLLVKSQNHQNQNSFNIRKVDYHNFLLFLISTDLLVKTIRSRQFSYWKSRQSQFSSFLDLNSSTCQNHRQQSQIFEN